MLFIGNLNFWIFLLIIEEAASAVSYNQPQFCSDSLWSPNATTVANISMVGSYLYDIFINTNNTVYVPNQNTGQIIVWSEENITLKKTISGNLFNSSSLFVTTTSDIYVDTFHSIGGVSKLTSNSTIGVSRMNICQQCLDIFIDTNNQLYCSLSERHQIIAKPLSNDLNPLTIVGGTGTAGSTPNMLNIPRGIFVDTALNLYVADCGNNRIQLFLSRKLSATTVAGNGSKSMTIPLNCPTSIILDGDKYLFIVDSSNHRIVRSISSGFLCLFGCSGSSGSASNQLSNPWSISFDSYGNIFVTDQGNNRVQKISLMTNVSTQCSNYTLITDGTRNVNYSGGCSVCDQTGSLASTGWYRFSGAAGTMLANFVVPSFQCNTCATGWYNGTYPSTAGQTTCGTVCYNYLSNTCSWSNTISITNCNGYYVFHLSPPPSCYLRYCTI